MWEEAGKAGLVLGLTSTAYLFLNQYLSMTQMSDILKMLINTLIWAAKFGGCIYLMAYYMKRFAGQSSNIDNSLVCKFGLAAALLSAIVYSAASFANTAFISADLINEQISNLIEQMAPAMDSNTLNKVDDLIAKLPQYTFFSNLFYCFTYGGVLSFILSRNIPSREPFANYTSDEQ